MQLLDKKINKYEIIKQNMNRLTKSIFFMICMIFMISIVSAVPPVTTVQQFPSGYFIEVHPITQIFKEGQDVTLNAHVFNSTNGHPINESIECLLHLYNSTGQHLVIQTTSTTDHLYDYEFYIAGGNFTKETKSYHIFCYDGEVGGDYPFAIEVTPTGTELTTSKSLIYLTLFLFLVVLFIISLYGIFYVENVAWKVGSMCFGWIILLSIFLVGWLFAQLYVYDIPYLETVLYIFWIVMMYGFFIFLITISMWLILKGLTEGQEKKFMKMGYSPEEASDMARRKRK